MIEPGPHWPRVANARTASLTTLAMLAFAASSLLRRMALGEGLIDAASFATVRVVSGAAKLALILLPRWRARGRTPVDRRSALMLFAYMVFFSFAYLSLSAGTGALILFGAVQLTMFIVALRSGEAFTPLSWAGLLLAIGGLVYLVSPGLTAPDPAGALLMAVAGIAWGLYSLSGRYSADPLEATANNFIFSVPLVLFTSVLFIGDFHASARGVALAEAVTLRLALASAATLGGVAIVLGQRAVRGQDAS